MEEDVLFKHRSDMDYVPGGDGFIIGGDRANICLAWCSPDYAWRNIPCLNTALVSLTG